MSIIVFATIALCILFGLRLIRITLSFEGVTVQRLWFQSSLLWQDIESVSSAVDISSPKPPFLTKLRSKNVSKRGINLNFKLLSKADVTFLAQQIIQNCPSADIDDVTKRMAEGMMPSRFK